VTERTTVLIVDDQDLVRTGLEMIVGAAPDLEVVGQATDGAEAVRAAQRLRPDVVLMDVRMPEMDGIEATRRIVATCPAPGPRVLMLTTFDLDDYVFDAFAAGASGFLVKDAPRQTIVDGVRAVARGEGLASPSVTRRLIERVVALPAATAQRPAVLDELTPREHEVLVEIARGRSNPEIAARLYLSEKTVKTHVGRILMKLGVRDRVQAVVLAYEAGVVVPGRDDL
jgi:DNA-binding NarL/FixJ family response regulator